MEPIPLLERLPRELVILIAVPVQHFPAEIDPDGLAVFPQDALGIIEQIVRVDDADLDRAAVRRGARVVDGRPTGGVVAAAHLRPDETCVFAVVKDAAQLVVAGLARHIRLEARLLDNGRDAAAVIARGGVLRVPDQEREVELLQDGARHDGRVARLARRVVREGRARARALRPGRLVDEDAGVAGAVHGVDTRAVFLGRLVVRADAALDTLERRRNVRLLPMGWDQVVSDVFDKDAFTLETWAPSAPCRHTMRGAPGAPPAYRMATTRRKDDGRHVWMAHAADN